MGNKFTFPSPMCFFYLMLYFFIYLLLNRIWPCCDFRTARFVFSSLLQMSNRRLRSWWEILRRPSRWGHKFILKPLYSKIIPDLPEPYFFCVLSPCTPTENCPADLADLASSSILVLYKSLYLHTPIIICLSFHQVVITETRRVDTTWIVNGELTDRSALSDELANFCAQYPIYHVKKALESLEVTGIQAEG